MIGHGAETSNASIGSWIVRGSSIGGGDKKGGRSIRPPVARKGHSPCSAFSFASCSKMKVCA